MSLCRHFVRELRRSVLVETPDHENIPTSKRSSSAYEQMGDFDEVAGPSGHDRTPEQRLSAYLRAEKNGRQRAQNGSFGSEKAMSMGGNGGMGNGFGGGGGGSEREPRPSHMTSPDRRTNSGSPTHTVARNDIRASAEKILYLFLLPGSEREIVLPESVTAHIQHAIEDEGRDDPEVFDAAKDYVFQAMERDAFPGFLRAKAFGNLVPPSSMLRLIVGLLCLFGGFWAAFSLIFLDFSRATRLWVRALSLSFSLSLSLNSFLYYFVIFGVGKGRGGRGLLRMALLLPPPRYLTLSFLSSSSSPLSSASTRSCRSSMASTRSLPLSASASTPS